MEELYSFHSAMYRAEHRRNKFAAALKGVDLDKSERDAQFDEIRAKADALLAGVPEEEVEKGERAPLDFLEFGMQQDEDDEEDYS